MNKPAFWKESLGTSETGQEQAAGIILKLSRETVTLRPRRRASLAVGAHLLYLLMLCPSCPHDVDGDDRAEMAASLARKPVCV